MFEQFNEIIKENTQMRNLSSTKFFPLASAQSPVLESRVRNFPESVFQSAKLKDTIYDITERGMDVFARLIKNSLSIGEDTHFVCGNGFEKLPSWFPVWMNVSAKGNENPKLNVFINLSHYAKCSDDSSMRHNPILGLLIGGSVLKQCVINKDKIVSNKIILKESATLYHSLILRIVDRNTGISNNKSDVTKLKYLLSKFFLIYVIGLTDKEKIEALSIASLSSNDSVIGLNLLGSYITDDDFTDPTKFYSSLQKVLGSMNGMSYKMVFLQTAQTYGDKAPLMFEYFPYFLFMVMSVSASTSIFNAGSLIPTVEKNNSPIIQQLLLISEGSL